MLAIDFVYFLNERSLDGLNLHLLHIPEKIILCDCLLHKEQMPIRLIGDLPRGESRNRHPPFLFTLINNLHN